MTNNYVVDTSVVIERVVSKLVNKKQIKDPRILVPRAVVAELENQANKGQEIGLLGLEELQTLQELKKNGKIELDFIGNRPNIQQIKYAKVGGEIDALIRELAYSENAVLITADKIQAESAKAFGIKVMYIAPKKLVSKLEIEKFFDDKTMSAHLKEDCFVFGKKGIPGNWDLVKISKNILKNEDVKRIAKDIVEKSRIDPKAFIEISRLGSTIVQYKNYRIVIVKPPVADGWEITAVKPLKQLDLGYYKLPEKIAERVKEKARGVIIAGETGSGKSTFAASLATYYANNNKITKTVESPRDLVLPDNITQYSKNFASSEEMHDILFLSRPDYIIFDEMRDTPDFKLYTDLRLGGSNVLGVLHSATAIDAIQRFIGRLDTGMIPSVLDTILFIEAGNVARVLILKMTVKVPSGMVEADLARPVIEIIDFVSNKVEYEIYSYGEETVVIPLTKEISKVPARELAAKQIQREMQKYSDNVKVELVSDYKAIVYVDERDIARIIGKEGKTIDGIEKKLGISLDVREIKKEQVEKNGVGIKYDYRGSNKYLIFYVREKGKSIDFFIDDEYLFSAISGKKGEIKVHTKSKLGKTLIDATDSKRKIELRV